MTKNRYVIGYAVYALLGNEQVPPQGLLPISNHASLEDAKAAISRYEYEDNSKHRYSAECVEIREADGAQMFKTNAAELGYPHNKIIWMGGRDKVPGMTVGKKGFLTYTSTVSRGYFVWSEE